MHNHWSWGMLLLMALYLPLITQPSKAKELRPSDHGLKADPPQATPPQMSSFFGNATQPLPEAAKNDSDPSWTAQPVGGSNNVRKVLIVSSLVCGIAGVGLLVVAGFLFLRRTRRN
uniref:uncharacterized protein LOC122606151 n=1 Tax=Erigeron canadensis TaxID=72917 RepID=UPI001CB9BC55|nr:uncharacterized protein LOC122606151 [Erigeron canadensis]